jgi:RHS repeat-associated protein
VNLTAYDANNELTTWGTANLFYDTNGNMTSDGTHSYTWDARNRLKQIDLGNTASFTYDPFGRRATKSIVGTGTTFLYDGANPVQEVIGGTNTANSLSGGIDEVFQRTDSAGARSFLTDPLGSTLALTDSTGTVQTSYSFEPFGNTTVSGSAATNSFAYTGRELDATGLDFYRARYYNPQLQRFISEDPIGFNGGINVYAYALDNPISFIDPLGLDVTVTVYPGLNGNLFGHAGISVNGSAPVGFNPGCDSCAVISPILASVGIGNGSVVGAVLPVDPGRVPSRTILIPTSPEQDAQILQYISNRTNNPGAYNLFGRNCAQFVHSALGAGGIPSSGSPFPNRLADSLTPPPPPQPAPCVGFSCLDNR